MPNIIVDCSHDNSKRCPEKQTDVMLDVVRQIRGGETAIVGAMIESNLEKGSQPIDGTPGLRPGVSITDPCLGWNETEKLVLEVYDGIGERN
jgi:3-deoxy-7-phosphoheptulonate synthase